jgi:hypothetical protein
MEEYKFTKEDIREYVKYIRSLDHVVLNNPDCDYFSIVKSENIYNIEICDEGVCIRYLQLDRTKTYQTVTLESFKKIVEDAKKDAMMKQKNSEILASNSDRILILADAIDSMQKELNKLTNKDLL